MSNPLPGSAPASTPDAGASADGVSLRKALVLISVVQLMLVLDSTITNIALPHVARDLGLSQASLTWMVTAYALTFGGLLILGGRLGDMLGRRRTFTIGLMIFATASLIGGLATEGWMLLFARGLQGVGAALASPAALALIATNFPAGPQRNRAMGVYAGMSGIGAAMGLLLGGWLTGIDSIFGIDVTGWRLTLLINAPIGLLGAVLAPRWLRESERNRNPLDLPGTATGTLGMFALVYGLTRAGDADAGWNAPETIVSIVVGVLLLAAFLAIEKKVEHPLLPLRIIKDRTRGTSYAAMLFASMAMMSMFYFNGQFVQRIVGYAPFKAGLAFLPFSMSVMVGTIVASILVARYSIRWITGAGTLLAAIALYGFSRYTVDDSPAHAVARTLANGGVGDGDSFAYLTDFFPFLALMGLGMGLTFVPMTLTAVHNIKAEDTGVGSSVLNTVTQIGGAFGLGLLSTVSLHFINQRDDEVTGQVRQLLEGQGVNPDATIPGGGQTMLDAVLFQTSFTEGATAAFAAAAGLMIVASLVMVTFMRVQPAELGQVRKKRGGAADEAAPEVAAEGTPA